MDVPARNMNEKEFLLEFISLYREFPQLWKLKSKDYMDKNKRQQGIQKMVEMLKLSRPTITEEEVKKKN